MPLPNNVKAKIVGTGFAFFIMILAGLEGVRTDAYQDIVGVWTICYGHTAGVHPGDEKTREECHALLSEEGRKYWDGVDALIIPNMKPREQIAFTLLAYNIGMTAFAKSSVVRNANANNFAAACLSILNFNKARTRAGLGVVKGLDRRRHIEHDICVGATVE